MSGSTSSLFSTAVRSLCSPSVTDSFGPVLWLKTASFSTETYHLLSLPLVLHATPWHLCTPRPALQAATVRSCWYICVLCLAAACCNRAMQCSELAMMCAWPSGPHAYRGHALHQPHLLCTSFCCEYVCAPSGDWPTRFLTLRVPYTSSCCEYVCVLWILADVLAHLCCAGA